MVTIHGKFDVAMLGSMEDMANSGISGGEGRAEGGR